MDLIFNDGDLVGLCLLPTTVQPESPGPRNKDLRIATPVRPTL